MWTAKFTGFQLVLCPVSDEFELDPKIGHGHVLPSIHQPSPEGFPRAPTPNELEEKSSAGPGGVPPHKNVLFDPTPSVGGSVEPETVGGFRQTFPPASRNMASRGILQVTPAASTEMVGMGQLVNEESPKSPESLLFHAFGSFSSDHSDVGHASRSWSVVYSDDQASSSASQIIREREAGNGQKPEDTQRQGPAGKGHSQGKGGGYRENWGDTERT